ncbi:VOC family protein [Ilumatobacter nonamiensis]|uniref:VOC family protein n=1 Tax=Ilumatobacter nonamiensis TaxID=467093 RepID=UPI00034548DA|nr:VOC family protein [Ilumatobacter nonamiensis]
MRIDRTNTILYCTSWAETVAFYRDVVGLEVSMERDWFVEFAVGTAGFVSVADATRTTVRSADGAGLTLSWRVDDLSDAWDELVDCGADPSPIAELWGSMSTFVRDPEGNRIELWMPVD